MSRVSVLATIDIDDVLSDVGLEDLGKYLRSALTFKDKVRLTKVLLADKPGDRDEDGDDLLPFVEEALALLQIGRADDAMLVLDRAAHPKWPTAEHALLAFKDVRQ